MELFEIVSELGEIIGTAPRSLCHADPWFVHRSVHVLVFGRDGKLLLQLRAKGKDVQPGKWDTSVGGHLAPGETYEQAAVREMREELGITAPLVFLYDYKYRGARESEDVRSFKAVHDGPFTPAPDEIDEVRRLAPDEIGRMLGTGAFTPNFEREYEMYIKSRLA